MENTVSNFVYFNELLIATQYKEYEKKFIDYLSAKKRHGKVFLKKNIMYINMELII